jgi:predicted helicase
MSRLLVTQYQAEVEQIIRYGGSRQESSICEAFGRLLNSYCKPRNYLLVPQLEYKTRLNTTVRPDGTIKDAIRLEHGWWESKDQYDRLDEEIEKKFAKGYPDENILFEDSQTAVLIQHSQEVARIPMQDAAGLDALLNAFVDYERPEVRDFRAAILQFKEDVPHILEELRNIIRQQESGNRVFLERTQNFLEVCRQSINPDIAISDVHEMLIQHILTEDIFTNIFHDSQFHRENNIARELSEIINTFFTGATRRNTLKNIEHYYSVIRRKSENIANHHEKQKFLKAVYENFYQAYNPKAADRLGIVYTPNEIVRFMIESTEHLVHKHFGKLLSDPGVEILDPCTGTGTYITELIDYLPASKLEHKYKNEIHCNELAILPYYIANLNIEYTYQQKMGQYEEFKNICLVDTLDHCTADGHQFDLFAMSVQNTARIQQQNDRTISVIIGNPPYNANQSNDNDNNKNRSYEEVDKAIKSTYVKESRAQKSKVYDMYSRFFRWATDRISENGILAFITNSSFIDARNFDGFRKVVSEEFSHIYIIDLGGNVRANPKLSGTTHNVFGIQAGVAISFLVKNKDFKCNDTRSRIFYSRRPELETAEEKIDFIKENKINDIEFQDLKIDANQDWLGTPDNDFKDLLLLFDKSERDRKPGDSIFSLYSNGLNTGRDEWVYDFSLSNLISKMRFFFEEYHQEMDRWERYKRDNKVQDNFKEYNPILNDLLAERDTIKWSERIKRDKLRKKKKSSFKEGNIVKVRYRPYCPSFLFFDYLPLDLIGQFLEIFSPSHSYDVRQFRQNFLIVLSGLSSMKPFQVLATDFPTGYDFLEKTRCLPLYRYDENGNRIDNITDWALTQFQTHYQDPTITKDHIFHYTYAVLHHPAYRTKYEINLKREFPRLPFYANFHQWATWGKSLMDLHLNYETIEPYDLKRVDKSTGKTKPVQTSLLPTEDLEPQKTTRPTTPKAKLKAEKADGTIILDTETTLEGIPALAWDYKLGNRSALEWILDQYKEKTPKDPTIRELFNTYKFADYKDHVIDLLKRVCTVSLRTMEIIHQMPETVDHQDHKP